MGANGNLVHLRPGRQFGMLTVLRRDGRIHHNAAWLCRCECGVEVRVRGDKLRAKLQRSCGGSHRKRPFLHAVAGVEHGIWRGMLERCYNKKNSAFKNYGVRGIRVCKAWRESFEQFVSDVRPRPSSNYSLDRYPDNDGNYEPNNVRWATAHEQANNTRKSILVLDGKAQVLLRDYLKRSKIERETIEKRLQNGWPLEEAILTPGTNIVRA